jgi:hypothetical protein
MNLAVDETSAVQAPCAPDPSGDAGGPPETIIAALEKARRQVQQCNEPSGKGNRQ